MSPYAARKRISKYFKSYHWHNNRVCIIHNGRKSKWKDTSELYTLLMTEGSNYEGKKLMEFFWGVPDEKTASPYEIRVLGEGTFNSTLPPKQLELKPEECTHDYIEVTLFHTPQFRCKWCDTKKS